MAKKVKSTKKKATSVARHAAHHKAHNEFVLIAGGGLVVILLIFFMSGSFKSPMSQQGNASESQTQMEAQNEQSVTIADFSYAPSTFVVKPGTTVTWTNQDTDSHSATADDGSFDTGLLQQGESGSVTFDQVGEYTYHCSVHPNMTGKIVVAE